MEWILSGIGLVCVGLLLVLVGREFRTGSKIAALQAEKERLLEERTRLESDLQRMRTDFGSTVQQLEQEKSIKDDFAGQLKQLKEINSELKTKIAVVESARDQANEKIIGYEKEKKSTEERFANQMTELDRARRVFEEEKARVRRGDDERQQQIIDERKRQWNEHQNVVGAKLKELCQRPETGFTLYDSANLPRSFDGGLKPDYLVELFSEQYLIFDAKFSESKISGYFTTQVPVTVQKIRKSSSRNNIYPTIFFVVPVDSLREVKKVYAFEDGFSFFMISPESLAPVLACYKKMTAYEFAKQLDPQEREDIISVISTYETFIRYQNAANVRLAQKAFDVTRIREHLMSIELNEQIELKRREIKPPKLKDADVKRLASSSEEMEKAVQGLTAPRAELEKIELEEAANTLL